MFDLGTLQQMFSQGNMSPGGLAGQLGAAAGQPGGPGAMAGALAGGQQPMGPMAALMQNPQFQQLMQAKMGGGMMGDPKMMAAQQLMGMGQPQPGQAPTPMPVAQPGMPGGGGMGMGMGRRPGMAQGYMAQGGGVQPRRLVGGGY